MNSQHPPAQTPASSRASGTRLQERWLSLARIAWLAVAVLAVGVFLAGLQPRFAELQQVCTNYSVCEQQSQLSLENVQQLQALGLSINFWAIYNNVVSVIFMSVWSGIGALIFWRRSDDRVALLVSLFLVTFALSFSPEVPNALARAYPIFWPLVEVLRLLGDVLCMLFFYLFPSGEFVPGWTRYPAVGWVAHRILNLFVDSLPPNPWLELPFFLLFLGFIVSFVYAQVYRYRRVSNPVQRQQTKWVVFGVAVSLVVVVGFLSPYFVFQLTGIMPPPSILLIQTAGGNAFMLLIPLSIGVAVLRSRLFDIDVLINRTLVYGTLTVSLALVYVGSVLVLQRVFVFFSGQGSSLAIVASTLAIAALFNPLRHRVQGFIDHRFYRSKYDAAKTLETFSAKLRDETDLDALSAHLVGVVSETMQPAHVSLWLRPTQEATSGEGVPSQEEKR